MISLIFSIAVFWYFFNFIENNSYIKNVTIYSVSNFILLIIEQAVDGNGFKIFYNIILSIIGGLICVKIMEFSKSKTNSLLSFLILTEIIFIIINVVVAFIFNLIF